MQLTPSLLLALVVGLSVACSTRSGPDELAAKPAAENQAVDPAAGSGAEAAEAAAGEPTTAVPAAGEPTTAVPAAGEPTTAEPATEAAAGEPTTAEPAAEAAAGEPTTANPAAKRPLSHYLTSAAVTKVYDSSTPRDTKLLETLSLEETRAFLARFDLAQIADGPLVRCPPTRVYAFEDAAGTKLGSISFCRDHARFDSADGDFGGIDAPTLP